MIRQGGIVLALALLPTLSAAQIPTGADRTHTVRAGESLSGIAKVYYGAASAWGRIFEANQDRLSDPDELRVGAVLVIPTAGPTVAPPARVTTVQIAGPEVAGQDVLSFEARRALLEYRPFEPLGVPEVPLSERSVFFDIPVLEAQAATVVLEAAEAVPAFPPSIFHAAGWLAPEGDRSDRLGEVVGFADGRDLEAESPTGQLYEDVYIRIPGVVSLQLGDVFLVYRVARTIEGLGDVVEPSGLLRVIEAGDGEAVAEIVQEFGRVQVGQFVIRARTFPLEPGVHPAEADRSLEVRILAMQEQKEFYLPGDFAFIDGGRARGLAIGDELVGLSNDEADWAGSELARFQVVGLQDEVGTVRLVLSESPRTVRPGLRVVVDRKMP